MVTCQTLLFGDSGSSPTSPHQLFLKPIPYAMAVQCYERWHYLGRQLFMSSINYGVFFENRLLGCISYGVPNAMNIKGLFTKNDQFGWYEIKRLALSPDCPKNSESRVIGISKKMFIKQYHVKGIVTYADSGVGHTGIIYRASGFTYIGLTAPKTDLFINGKKVGKKGQYHRGKKEEEEWRPRSRKHLFVWRNLL